MRHELMGAIALAGVLLLTPAASAADEARGTASTDLLGIELDVDAGTLGTVVTDLTNQSLLPSAIDVLDVGTLASIDVTDRTGRDTSWAEGGVVPLRVDGTEIGAVKAESSDGSESGSSDGATLGSVTDLTSAVGASIAPLVVQAHAAEDQASATVDTLVAQVAALLQTVHLDVEVSQLSSMVDQLSAASGVSVEVNSLDLTLGDLLPADVLTQLPLDDLLSLLEALDVEGLTTELQALIDELRAVLANVDTRIAAVEATGQALTDAATTLEDIQAATDLLDLLSDTNALLETAATIDVTDLTAVTQLVSDTLDLITTAAALGITHGDCTGLALDALDLPGTVAAAEACSNGLKTETLAALATLVDGELADEVQALEDAVDALVLFLNTVRERANALAESLTNLDLLVNQAAGTELLAVDGVTIGVSAISTGDLGTSSAVVGCTPVTATVLGTSYTTPSCSEGLSAVQDVAATVSGAVSTVESILAGLPITDLASVGDLELELFGTLEESVVEDGDYVVSTAQIELLELVLPALTVELDPASLGDLALPDVMATVENVVHTAVTEINGIFGGVLDASQLTTLTDPLLALVADTGALDTAVEAANAALSSLLELLPDLELGSFTTPSLSLTIDPASTSEFAVAAAAPPPSDDNGSGAPLPTTGGGLAVLGIASLAGALALLRKRR